MFVSEYLSCTWRCGGWPVPSLPKWLLLCLLHYTQHKGCRASLRHSLAVTSNGKGVYSLITSYCPILSSFIFAPEWWKHQVLSQWFREGCPKLMSFGLLLKALFTQKDFVPLYFPVDKAIWKCFTQLPSRIWFLNPIAEETSYLNHKIIIEVIPTCKSHSYWLAFILLEIAMNYQ